MNISTQPFPTLIDSTLHADLKIGLNAIRNNTHSGYFLTDKHSNIGPYEVNQLLPALKENSTLKELFLRGITLTNQQFIEIIQSTKNLERLDLTNSYIIGFDAKEVGKALNLSSIKSLDLIFTIVEEHAIIEEQARNILHQLNEDRKRQTSISLWGTKISLVS